MDRCLCQWVDLAPKVPCPQCQVLDQGDLMVQKARMEVHPEPHWVALFLLVHHPTLAWATPVADPAQPQVVTTAAPAQPTPQPPAQLMVGMVVEGHPVPALLTLPTEDPVLLTVGMMGGRPHHIQAWEDHQAIL